MPTVLEIARHADVAAEQVLRVIHGEPVSGQVAERVRASIAALGPPPRATRPVEVLPAPRTAVEGARDQLEASVGRAASVLDDVVPERVESVVYEALRVEVRPVAEHVTQVGHLVDELVKRLAELRADNGLQRKERLEDLELITELMTSGWRSVDRRLGRLERMVERLQPQPNGNATRRPFHAQTP